MSSSALLYRRLEAFRAVVAAGSFTQAARRLQTSQPSISRLMRELQDELGFRLFRRVGVSAVPTAQALELFREIERSMTGVDDIMRRARDIRDHQAGVLRILSMPALAHAFLPSVMAEFLAARPNVNASLQVLRSEAVPDRLSTQRYDLGFAMFPVSAPGLRVEPFDPACGRCVMRADHPLAQREVITAHDLAGERMVAHGPDALVRTVLEAALLSAGVRPPTRVETPLSSIACEFVRLGLGVTIADPFTAAAFVERGLVSRPFSPAIHFEFGMLHPTGHDPSPLVGEFVDLCRRRRDGVPR